MQHPPLRFRLNYGDSREALAIGNKVRFIDHSVPASPSKISIQDLATFEDHDDDVFAAAFSPDGTTLATTGRSKKVILYDVAGTGEITGTIDTKHVFYCTCLAYSNDGKMICTGSWDKTIRIWSVETRQMIRGEDYGSDDDSGTTAGLLKGQHTNGITAVQFSPNGKFIASTSNDNKVVIWNIATRENTKILAGHASYALSLCFAPDGKMLYTSGADKAICYWNTATEDFEGELLGHSDWVNCLSMSRCGKFLVSSSQDRTVRTWNLDTKTEISKFECATFFVPSCVALSPDAQTVCVGAFNEHVLCFDVKTKKIISLYNNFGANTSASTSSCGGDDDSNNNNDGDDEGRPAIAAVFDSPGIHAHTSQVRSVAWAPDGSAFSSSSKDFKVKLFNIVKGTVVGDAVVCESEIVSMRIVDGDKSPGRNTDDDAGGLWDSENGGGAKQRSLPRFFEILDAKGNAKRSSFPEDSLFEVKRKSNKRAADLERKRKGAIAEAEAAATAAASNFTSAAAAAASSQQSQQAVDKEQQQETNNNNNNNNNSDVVEAAPAAASEQPEQPAVASKHQQEEPAPSASQSRQQASPPADGGPTEVHPQKEQQEEFSSPSVHTEESSHDYHVAAATTNAPVVPSSTSPSPSSLPAAQQQHQDPVVPSDASVLPSSSSFPTWLASSSTLSKQIREKLLEQEINSRDLFVSLNDEELKELFPVLGQRKLVKAEVEKMKMKDDFLENGTKNMAPSTAALSGYLDEAFANFKADVLVRFETQQAKK